MLETAHFKLVFQYHREKYSYYGPETLEPCPPSLLAAGADTVEGVCPQKAKYQSALSAAQSP